MHQFLIKLKERYEHDINNMILEDQVNFYKFACKGFVNGSFFSSNLPGIGGKIIVKANGRDIAPCTKYRKKIKGLLTHKERAVPIVEFFKKLDEISEALQIFLAEDFSPDKYPKFCLDSGTWKGLAKFDLVVDKPDWREFKKFFISFLEQMWEKFASERGFHDMSKYEFMFDKFIDVVDRAFQDLTPSRNFDVLTSPINSKTFPTNNSRSFCIVRNYRKFMAFIKKIKEDRNIYYYKFGETKFDPYRESKLFETPEESYTNAWDENIDHCLNKYNCFIGDFTGWFGGDQRIVLIKDGEVEILDGSMYHRSDDVRRTNKFLAQYGLKQFFNYQNVTEFIAFNTSDQIE